MRSHRLFLWVMLTSSLVALVFSIALIIRIWDALGPVALSVGLFLAALAVLGAIYGLIRLWLDIQTRRQRLRLEREAHVHTQQLEAEKYVAQQQLAQLRFDHEAWLARREFELRQHLALTRAEADELGNYPYL